MDDIENLDEIDPAFESSFGGSLQEKGVEIVRLIFSDLHGIARGKDVFLKGLESDIREGITFCTSSLTDGLGSNTTIAPGLPPDRGYPDMRAKILPLTLRQLPWEPETAWCLADLEDALGPIEIAPRNLLKRVVKQYHQQGLKPIIGPELEFFLLQIDKNGKISRYNDKHSCVYMVGQRSDPKGIIREMLKAARDLGLLVSAANQEHCRGQFEINMLHSEAVDAADRAFQMKVMVKELAERHGLLATFMGKPFNDDDSSGFHIHLSLNDQNGINLFTQPETEDHLSSLARHFLAGVLEHASALMAFFAPTINSYKRLDETNSLVSTTANWAYDNRTSFIRVPDDYETNTRFEIRAPDASSNPYLVIATSLLAGFDGIQRRLEPPHPIRGDARFASNVLALPRTLNASLAALRADAYLCEAISWPLVKVFLAIKEAEAKRFDSYVTEWELNEYMWHL